MGRNLSAGADLIYASQTYLKSLEDRTIVVVSHDRSFLDTISKETILFRHKMLAYHAGSYSGMTALLQHDSSSLS